MHKNMPIIQVSDPDAEGGGEAGNAGANATANSPGTERPL